MFKVDESVGWKNNPRLKAYAERWSSWKSYLDKEVTIKVDCSLCGMKFESKEEVKKHKYEVHFKEKCDICNRRFQKRHLERHKLLVHSDDVNYVPCHICGKLLKDNLYVEAHIRRIHSKVRNKSFKCEVCNKSYYTYGVMQNHKKLVHESIEKVCHHCGKLFKHQTSLSCHIKTVHFGSAIVCDICGKTVKCISLHKKVNHMEQPPSTCDVCGKTFKRAKLMEMHKAMHFKERDHVCEICGRAFKCKSTLANHLRIHSDVREYTCKICNMTFKFKTVLKTHMRVHSGVTPYTCKKCNETFKWKQTYNKHIKKCGDNISDSDDKEDKE